MKKLVYNSSSEELNLLDYATNMKINLVTGEESEVTGDDEFKFIKDGDKLYDMINNSNNDRNKKHQDLDLTSVIEPVKGHLMVLVIFIAAIFAIAYYFSDSNQKLNEYPVIDSDDSLPATVDDIKGFIREYEYRNNVIVTDWRRGLIMNSALGLKRSRAHYVVDSISDEQKVKYGRK